MLVTTQIVVLLLNWQTAPFCKVIITLKTDKLAKYFVYPKQDMPHHHTIRSVWLKLRKQNGDGALMKTV
jgi:hypothetical protein